LLARGRGKNLELRKAVPRLEHFNQGFDSTWLNEVVVCSKLERAAHILFPDALGVDFNFTEQKAKAVELEVLKVKPAASAQGA
jgi:hypothetical protein